MGRSKESRVEKLHDDIIKMVSKLEGNQLNMDILRLIGQYVFTLIKNSTEAQQKELKDIFDVARQYNALKVDDLVALILLYNEHVRNTAGSNFIEKSVIDAVLAKRKAISIATRAPETESREIKLTEKPTQKYMESEKEGKGSGKSVNPDPYTSKIPEWVYLGGAACFIKLMDGGNRAMIGQVDGARKEGIIINSTCASSGSKMVGMLPNRESCSIALTVAKFAKVLRFDTVIENFLGTKDIFIGLLQREEILISKDVKGEDVISKDDLVKHLRRSLPFKDTDFIFIERVELESSPLVDIDIDTNPFSKNAITDAGRVFMFELVFGGSENNAGSHIVRKNIRYVTKVFTNPRDIRVKKMLIAARSSIDSMIRNKAERQFFKTESTILDDARFIQGMQDVRRKIKENKEILKQVVDFSKLPENERNTIKENIDVVTTDAVSLGDLMVTLTENESSPLSRRAVSCKLVRPVEGNKQAKAD